MEKKIKSVKLRNTELIKSANGGDKWLIPGTLSCFTGEYIRNDSNVFEIEYEPERKFIDVRIEYDNRVKLYGEDITANSLERFFHDDFVRRNQIKVIELPEVFTREDMIDFAYKCRHLVEFPESRIDKFISERKSNGR